MEPADKDQPAHEPTERALKAVKARWELPSEGPDEPRRRRLIELAFLVASAVQPGFEPPRTRHEVSSSYEADEQWGGSHSRVVYRLGDAEQGVEITDRVSDPEDGITPFESSTEVEVYGLPVGWSIMLHGYFAAPMCEIPRTMGMEGTLPETEARVVADLLTKEVGPAATRRT